MASGSGGPSEWALKFALEDLLRGVKLMEMTQPFALALSCRLGHQSDQLAARDANSVTGRPFLNRLVNAAERRLAEVGDVHRYLRLAVREHPHSLNAGKAPSGRTDFAGNGARSGDIGGVQIKIPCDEEAAHTHGGGSGGGVQIGPSHVWTAGDLAFHRITQAFELALAHLFQKRPVGTSGGSLVEIDRNTVAIPERGSSLSGEEDAL